MVPLILLVALGLFLEYKLDRIGRKLTFEEAYKKAQKRDTKYCRKHPACSSVEANRNRDRVMRQYGRCL